MAYDLRIGGRVAGASAALLIGRRGYRVFSSPGMARTTAFAEPRAATPVG